jgi:hypothetical protein
LWVIESRQTSRNAGAVKNAPRRIERDRTGRCGAGKQLFYDQAIGLGATKYIGYFGEYTDPKYYDDFVPCTTTTSSPGGRTLCALALMA